MGLFDKFKKTIGNFDSNKEILSEGNANTLPFRITLNRDGTFNFG